MFLSYVHIDTCITSDPDWLHGHDADQCGQVRQVLAVQRGGGAGGRLAPPRRRPRPRLQGDAGLRRGRGPRDAAARGPRRGLHLDSGPVCLLRTLNTLHTIII